VRYTVGGRHFLTIQALISELHEAVEPMEGITAIYLFGSALTDESPRDVDLAVVYGAPLSAVTVVKARPTLDAAVSRAFNAPAHIMFLSTKEADEPGMLTRLEPSLLYGAG
jgi:predicted nucleotidyltransferase